MLCTIPVMVTEVRAVVGEGGHVVIGGVSVRGQGLELRVLSGHRVVGGVVSMVGVWHPAGPSAHGQVAVV